VLHGDLGDDTLSAVRDEGGDDGDPRADTLFGGFGSDVLAGDNGDTLDGGAGRDSYEVYNWNGAGDLVVIDDLQPGEQIRILWNGAVGTEVPRFVIAPNGEDTIISNSVIVRGRVDFANFDVVIGPLHP
jgi:Ca2+-binding RTX toxin-like protein